MGNRAWKRWVIASIVAVMVWGAGSSKAAEQAQPKAFNSAVAFDVYAVIGEEGQWMGEDRQLVGHTPSEQPLTIPACKWWCVEPLRGWDMDKVRQEVEAHRVPGLKFSDATDRDLERVQGLAGLQYLDLSATHVTDARLEHLKGLTELQYLDLWSTRVTGAGLVHLKGLTGLQYLDLLGTRGTDAGLEHLRGLTALR